MARKKKKRVTPGQWLRQRKSNTAKKIDTIVSGWRVPYNRVIIPLYDYKRGRASKKYLITDHGEVISFTKAEPKIIKTRSSDDYDHCTINKYTYYIHRGVWFSFAYHWIKNPSAVNEPLAFEKITSKEQLDELRKAKVSQWNSRKRKREFKARYEIHHQDSNERNNCYSNLVLEDEAHEILTKIRGARELAEEYGKSEDGSILMLVHNESESSGVVYYKGGKTRTEKIQPTAEKWEKRMSDPYGVVDMNPINDMIMVAYADKYGSRSRKDRTVLFWIGDTPHFRKIKFQNRKLTISKIDQTKDIDIYLGDIIDVLPVTRIATKEDMEDIQKVTTKNKDSSGQTSIEHIRKEDL